MSVVDGPSAGLEDVAQIYIQVGDVQFGEKSRRSAGRTRSGVGKFAAAPAKDLEGSRGPADAAEARKGTSSRRPFPGGDEATETAAQQVGRYEKVRLREGYLDTQALSR